MSEKFVLVCLAEYADDFGECWPKKCTIAERLEISAKSVSRAFEKLFSLKIMTTNSAKNLVLDLDKMDTMSIKVDTMSNQPLDTMSAKQDTMSIELDTMSPPIRTTNEPPLNSHKKTKQKKEKLVELNFKELGFQIIPNQWLEVARSRGFQDYHSEIIFQDCSLYWQDKGAATKRTDVGWLRTWNNWLNKINPNQPPQVKNGKSDQRPRMSDFVVGSSEPSFARISKMENHGSSPVIDVQSRCIS